jgi:hypothetical protein
MFGRMNTAARLMIRPSASATALTVRRNDQLSNLAVNDADSARLELLPFGFRQLAGMREEDQVV